MAVLLRWLASLVKPPTCFSVIDDALGSTIWIVGFSGLATCGKTKSLSLSLLGAAAYSKTFLAVTRKLATNSNSDNHLDRLRGTRCPSLIDFTQNRRRNLFALRF